MGEVSWEFCPGMSYSRVIVQGTKIRTVIVQEGGNFMGCNCPEGSCPGGARGNVWIPYIIKLLKARSLATKICLVCYQY